MKIVHISSSNRGGGAAIAMMRLSDALRKKGFDSVAIVEKGISCEGCRALGYGRLKRYCDAILFYIIKTLKKTGITWNLLLFGRSIINVEEVKTADVVVLHYINEFLNFRAIEQLLKSEKRVVWFMHDMWTMTGGCHHSLECNGYTNQCDNCPQLKKCKWLAKWQLKKKQQILKNKELYAASPSKWLADCLYKSSLFKDANIYVCPNLIDTDIFKPVNKSEARKLLNLNTDRKYVLFGAAAMTSLYKGMSYVYKTLENLGPEYDFIVLGNIKQEEFPLQLKERTHIMGFVNDDKQKRLIYSAADLFLITSIAENYPNMVIESFACGTPVVGFMTGGIIEQIRHQETGWLAPVGDVKSLIKGIDWVIKNNTNNNISTKAREYVLRTCSYDKVEEIYGSLLLL